MTTDITELAQKPTRYGTNSQGVFTNQTDGAYVSYLDFMALVEALEKAQAINAAAEKLVRCKGRYHSEQNYRALAALFGVTAPDLPPLEAQPAQSCEHSMFWDVSGVRRCSKCDIPEHANVHYADAAEMEIAALRQRIAELDSFRTAYMEWSDKTDWVRTDRRFDVVKPLGKHLADVLKAYIEHLESRTVKLPCSLDFDCEMENGDYDIDEEPYLRGKVDGFNYALTKVRRLNGDAGIKWEAE